MQCPAWTQGIFTDGTRGFVSNPCPKTGERVSVFLQCPADASADRVYLRRLSDGAEEWIPMLREKEERGLARWRAEFTVRERVTRYWFALAGQDGLVFYTQAGPQDWVPGEAESFVLLADFVQPSWVRGAVMYQIFPDRFARSGKVPFPEDIPLKGWEEDPLPGHITGGREFYGGDLYGIIERIPWLKELGVTVLYLNPVFRAPSSHRYDCTDYFHVDGKLGGDEALAALSKALHREGMRLILDISINHTGIEHPWVKDHPDYYLHGEDGSLVCWCGFPSLPVLDYRNGEVRDLIYRGATSVLRKWLRPPYSADGWRFDVADVFGRCGRVQLADELWPEICDAIREENPEALIVGEHWGDCTNFLQGDLWNTPMNYFGFGRIIRQFTGLPDLFLDRVEGLRAVPQVLTAEEVVRRTDEHFARIPQVIAQAQMNLFDSHDIPRLHRSKGASPCAFRAAVIAQLLWTGIPCIYYGDELAAGGFSEDDAGCRFPMPWGRNTAEAEEHTALIRRMAWLRRNVPAFAEGSRKVLYAQGRTLAAARFLDGEVYVGILCMEEGRTWADLPLGLVGAGRPAEDLDLFGTPLSWEAQENGNCRFLLEGPCAVLFACT